MSRKRGLGVSEITEHTAVVLGDAMKKIKISSSPGEIRLEKEIQELSSIVQSDFLISRDPGNSCVLLRLFTGGNRNADMDVQDMSAPPESTQTRVCTEFSLTVSKYYPHVCPEIRVVGMSSLRPPLLHLFEAETGLLRQDHPLVRNWNALGSVELVIRTLLEIVEQT